jgi:heat-inducible transcriptional repressor
VDNLLTLQPIDRVDLTQVSRQLDPDMSAQELVESASGILSEVTHMAGLVTIPRRDQTILRHLEFLPLSDHRVLVILVLDDHEVQNRVIQTEQEYTEVQLREAANFLNHSFVGQDVMQIRRKLIDSMQNDRESMNSLMKLAISIAEQSLPDDEQDAGDYVLAGQENLLDLSQSTAVEDLRALFQAFSTKSDILDLLDRSMESEGIQLFIGHESGYEILDDCSVVTSAYQIDGKQVGVLGVVGPTRMPYQRIIPAVDVTARLLSAALGGARSKNTD